MRVTYRSSGVKEYWAQRWSNIPADRPMENRSAYPLKYAELIVDDKTANILEAGCGAGRLLRYYKDRGYSIIGIDYIEAAVEKLKTEDPQLQVEVGDITKLTYDNASFRTVLAFGLYHNLQGAALERAIAETFRVLEPEGRVCASFRADNLQTRLTDWMADYRAGKAARNGAREFHKLNLTRGEFEDLFRRAGFMVEQTFPVENMPILYKFALFRSRQHKTFDENLARKEGYQLSPLGGIIQRFLMRLYPYQFCNIFVVIARKP